jgi:hypothetical protein
VNQSLVRTAVPAFGTSAAATTGSVAIVFLPRQILSLPSACPRRIGPSTSAGASSPHCRSAWPLRTMKRRELSPAIKSSSAPRR